MDTVKVAVRVRPLVSSEIENGFTSCIERLPDLPQIKIGKLGQSFSYDHVFDELEGQNKFYNTAVKDLIENLFKGYNLTILAYGQTGSGKTYTMGTNYSSGPELGVIPRSINDIFKHATEHSNYVYNITCSFIELYNESLYDLLTNKTKEQSILDMRENNNGVYLPGLTEIPVRSADDTFNQLKKGSSVRVTGATSTNSQSSRSHAVFTINMKIVNKDNPKDIISSKFQLVDLAGSERSKKSETTGVRLKEGININKGLLVLGNVISQLGEGQSFISYRDSKLTRLLQDSLGGNSVTLMIACISPADFNEDESLNTLRYADRARNVKNKPVVNKCPQYAEISTLKQPNEDLRLRVIEGGVAEFNCPPQQRNLEEKLADARNEELTQLLAESVMRNSAALERSLMVEKMDERLKEKLDELSRISEGTELSPNEDSNKFIELKIKIKEIQDLRRQSAQELFNHSADAEMVQNHPSDLNHEQILLRAQINKEISKIAQSLVWKEELKCKLTLRVGSLGDLEDPKKQLELLHQQNAALQAEKDALLKKLLSISKSTCNNQRISEEIRKRLQELEAQTSCVQANILELKLIDSYMKKITKVQQEITEMKRQKEKLINCIEHDSISLKNLKTKSVKEIMILKDQNSKKQYEIEKMKQNHELQQNVLKRKLEHAAEANKKIMSVLERQKQSKLKLTRGSAAEEIKVIVNEKLETIEAEYQARKSLESLIQDNVNLANHLMAVEESINSVDVTTEEKANKVLEKKQIEDDMALKNADISDLTQKMLDIRHETRDSWEIIETMADAKFALTHLFQILCEKTKDLINASQTITELRDTIIDYEAQLNENKHKIESFETESKSLIQVVENECEEKIYILLKRIENMQDSSTFNELAEECFKIQTEELEKINELKQKLKVAEEENAKFVQIYAARKPAERFQDACAFYVNNFENLPLDSTLVETKKSPTKKKAHDSKFELVDSPKAGTSADEPTAFYSTQKRVKPPYEGRCFCAGKCVKRICHCNKNDKRCNENCSCGEKCTNQPDSDGCSPLKRQKQSKNDLTT